MAQGVRVRRDVAPTILRRCRAGVRAAIPGTATAVLAPLVLAAALGVPAPARAQILEVNGTTQTLGGYHVYDEVRVINGGRLLVPVFDGSDRTNTGNLVLRARLIRVDETSSISATGAGYQTARCGNGGGPTAAAGGRGGCALRDSGGGGAHFGAGGRGTKDCFVYGSTTVCEFPQEWEEDCGNSLNAGGTACTTTADCRDLDGLPTVAGQPYRHSIYDVEFGAAGGDKGCRDGDGFGSEPNVAGPGGGRLVLAGLSPAADGLVDIRGQVRADGGPACGSGNDSAGGGAGGTVLIVGDGVTVGPAALVSAAGGLGGDTRGLPGGRTDCPAPAQQGGTCDDCGGGGGGGLIAVLSRTATLSSTARFDIRGALGGVCPICSGEAGGGSGELQLDGAFVGELCDGYDNDFDGATDEGLPTLAPCGLPSCVAGVPQQCPTDPSCIGPVTDTRPRFVVIVDSSGSMLTDLAGDPTYGDGSAGHAGIDGNGDGTQGNDSRLYLAKEALTRFVSAYTEIDFALARYHQDVSVNRSCQLAHWFECQGMCCTYDDPRDNTPPPAVPACTLDGGASGPVAVNMNSPAGEQCINYAGSCGPPRRGADVLVGFGRSLRQLLRWLDLAETSFLPGTTEGDHCSFASGGDCELRGTGPTPLAGALDAAYDYLRPVAACDGARACRTYGVILLTDGAESCRGDPVASAQALWTVLGIRTFVVGFSVLAEEEARLNAIARAGSGGASDAYFAADESALVNTLAAIVAGSIRTELCNGVDDDCDGATDEDFPDLGLPCDDGGIGRCRGTGVRVCNAAGDGTVCAITAPGEPPRAETCNGLDDDCDGATDEDGVCSGCVPSAEVCDDADNDCDGLTDEALTRACGSSIGECRPGTQTCSRGAWGACAGETPPAAEECNDLDDDCDGATDGMTLPCGTDTGACEFGARVCLAGSWGACVGGRSAGTEVCNLVDDDCDDATDEGDPGGGGECGVAVGLCTTGIRHCHGGILVCEGGVEPTAEECNGLDDDCDTAADEGNPDGGGDCYSGPPGTAGLGVCEDGVQMCVAGSLVCDGEVLPTAEDCNGLDDDCDTATDEDLPGGETCGLTDVGECALGSRRCADGRWVCDGEVEPIDELCNLLDDDCDGESDEDNPEGGQPCGWDPDAPEGWSLDHPGIWDEGICEPGVTACVGGLLECQEMIGPRPEECNGLDDDCDGETDDPEDLGVGGPCGEDEGECIAGTFECVDGIVQCVGGRGRSPEVCDCRDNDCDAETDEETECPGGAVCVDCSCAAPCDPGMEFACPEGKLCLCGMVPADPEGCYCVVPAEICGGVECDPCEECIADACVPIECGECEVCNPPTETCIDACTGVSCPAGQVCVCGLCQAPDCYLPGFECPAGERCRDHACEPDPCWAVSCDPPQFCRDGTCHDPCETEDVCPPGQVCYDGVCVADPCWGVACDPGEDCVDGTCTGRCAGVGCVPPLECDPATGECTEPPCFYVECAAGYECRDGTCVETGGPGDAGADGDGGEDAAGPGHQVFATGAGGCACRASGAGGARGGVPSVVGLLGLLLLRRRRRA
jgi:MYXO-CTERM domain-containing protein